jgi:hypothetical protein
VDLPINHLARRHAIGGGRPTRGLPGSTPRSTLDARASDGSSGTVGRRVTEDFYVQVRYPGGRRWVAVAVSEDRRLAASLAAAAYQNLADERGRTPTGVRIMSARELEIEGGTDAVDRAARDIADEAVQP